MSRPKRVFTEREIRLIKLYALNGGKNQTIANALDMPVNTLKNRFSKLLQKYRAQRKLKLRHQQTKQARTSSDMAKFLGRNELGQVDKQVIETNIQPPKMSQDQEEASREAARVFNLKMAQGA